MFTGTRDDPIILEGTPPSSSEPWMKVESSPVKVLPGEERIQVSSYSCTLLAKMR